MIVDPEGSGSSGWEPLGTCAKTGSAKMTAEAARIVATKDVRREKIREQPLDESDLVFIFLHTFKAVLSYQLRHLLFGKMNFAASWISNHSI
jgi:hypothetical protein